MSVDSCALDDPCIIPAGRRSSSGDDSGISKRGIVHAHQATPIAARQAMMIRRLHICKHSPPVS
eukprot:1837842-Alexandrium_andersonii.AAC.1